MDRSSTQRVGLQIVVRHHIDEKGLTILDDLEIGNMLNRLAANRELGRIGGRTQGFHLGIELADRQEIRNQSIARKRRCRTLRGAARS